MKQVSIIVGIIIVVAAGGGWYAATRKKATPPADSTGVQTTATAPTTTTASDTPVAADTITYTNAGFNPATLTVKSGDQLTITNSSNQLLQFDSDPHPEHTDDPELNVGVIAPGQSKSITVHTTGSHGYHNHLNADDTGTLIVQ